MNSKNILVPVDLVRSPSDSLVYAREMAADAPICVTLLYVLNLNIVTPSRNLYDELCAESEAALLTLARFFFGSEQSVRVVVRVGTPEKEILAEAEAQSADLIVLSAPERPAWKRLWRPATVQKIVDASPCPTVIIPRGGNKPLRSSKIPAPASSTPDAAILPAA